jgi:hypothetical protein
MKFSTYEHHPTIPIIFLKNLLLLKAKQDKRTQGGIYGIFAEQ